MADSHQFKEPTQPLRDAQPDDRGNLKVSTAMTPKTCTTRMRVAVPSSKVIPVIVIPGIMGSNLRATRDPGKPRNRVLKPGEEAWRPPNGTAAGIKQAGIWKERDPGQRQSILDPSTLDVDPDGEIGLLKDVCYFGVNDQLARTRGWGEVHWSSYGKLLMTLQHRLNLTFHTTTGTRKLAEHWVSANGYDRALWGARKHGAMAELTERELEKSAEYQYPLYAFGYNWLESNEKSAGLLEKRIADIMQYWTDGKQSCKSVILVTHSMGGLVARACAKNIPGKIAGVVHGVMPALGAPVCYRRIACGTEVSSPGNSYVENLEMEYFADIVGSTSAATTAVMATAPGVLELLPNHLYPRPWLFASVERQGAAPAEMLRLPENNPYGLYRDLTSWYRMIDPALADPANKYTGDVKRYIVLAINQAEKFHTTLLDTFYHPNTYAFYGTDPALKSFGTCVWNASKGQGGMSISAFQNGRLLGLDTKGKRAVDMAGGIHHFTHLAQNENGDGTVPERSGAGPQGKVRQLFRMVGFNHQRSYQQEGVMLLTQHLIARIVQEIT